MPPAPKITIKRTNKNYGLTLSGKLGSRVDLEEEYVRRFVSTDPRDGVTSLREAVLAAFADKNATEKEWEAIAVAQKACEDVREKLLAAGYSPGDVMKLMIDNSEGLKPI
jgi:2-hydroxychromene-2-carboxylate isomerase